MCEILLFSWKLTALSGPHHIDADADTEPECHFDADPYLSCQFDADPDPTFHFDADPDPSFQTKAQNLEKLLKLAPFPCILAYLHSDADPDPAYHFDADAYPDLAYPLVRIRVLLMI